MIAGKTVAIVVVAEEIAGVVDVAGADTAVADVVDVVGEGESCALDLQIEKAIQAAGFDEKAEN